MTNLSQGDHDGSSPAVRFKADWGGANLLRASGWLAQWIWEHTDDHRPSVIHNGRGMGDNLQALANGEVDIALATPASFAALALRGEGPFEGRPIPQLRALAALPHRDAMIPVAAAGFGFRNLDDVRRHDGPLRISLGVNDADGFMGFAADAVLAAAGIDLGFVIERGGTVTRHEQPFDSIADLHEGRADVMVSEAIMTPAWQALATQNDVTFLSLTDDEAASLDTTWGLKTMDIDAGYFPGADHPIKALDYSDWIIATTTSLPDALASLVARAIIEDGQTFARGYRHLPVDYSPLRYPIDHRYARTTSIETHPAAADEYDRADNQAPESD